MNVCKAVPLLEYTVPLGLQAIALPTNGLRFNFATCVGVNLIVFIYLSFESGVIALVSSLVDPLKSMSGKICYPLPTSICSIIR